MPIISIPYQPATSQLIAAYRPIVFQVQATRTDGAAQPPYVSCDIYIADVYYKSVLRTAPDTITSEYSLFQFDISDALQEYLQPDLATLNNNNVLQAPHMSGKVFCRFRSSGIDGDGFTVEEGTKPVQGTKFSSPTPGSGTQSNTFFVINAALQHEDNQNLASHLNAYKQGTWAANAFPLTHRNRYFFCNDDSDHFPFIYSGDCLATDIILNYRLKGQTSFQQATAEDINVCEAIGFTTEVTGNRVDVHLDADPIEGQTVLVQYKKQADLVWINVGNFAVQDFFFNVENPETAVYDIRVIHFCTPCLSSDPEVGTFSLDGEVTNLAWRGIDPFCVQQTFSQPIYVQLELRNPTNEDTFYPDNENPAMQIHTGYADLYCKFFSDAALLNPLNLVQNGLKIYIKQRTERDIENPFDTYYAEYESIQTYTVDANGVEVLLGNITTDQSSDSLPPLSESSTVIVNTYTAYPTYQLTGGNNGQKGFATLQEYNTDTNIPTGNTKPNDDSDPDYVPPVADATTCPSGPDQSTVTYGYSLEISKVEMRYGPGPTFVYSPTRSDTDSGGYLYYFPLPKNTDINVTVKARTLDSGNTNGYIKCTVNYYDSGGNFQTAEFNVTNNIETALPQTFQNITNINISNY